MEILGTGPIAEQVETGLLSNESLPDVKKQWMKLRGRLVFCPGSIPFVHFSDAFAN